MAAANAVRGHANCHLPMPIPRASIIHGPGVPAGLDLAPAAEATQQTAPARAPAGRPPRARYVRRLEMSARVDRYLRVHVPSQPEINKQLYMSSS
jgi:hypothetical protein